MIKKLMLTTMVATGLTLGSVSAADEVTELLQEAIEAYEQGDFNRVKENLSFTTQLLNEKAADALAAALPEPLPGWTASDADAGSSSAAGLLGGGVQASRTYSKDDSDVKIEIMGDSPILSQMMMMMSNPVLAGSMGKMVRIGKQRGFQSQDGEKITMVIDNRLMISIEGESSLDDKMAYAEAIDFAALQSL